jgi:hypothetical protein
LEGIRFSWKESGFVGRNQVLLEGIRFCWKESGFFGRNQVSLKGIRNHWKESGFVGRNQVLLDVLLIWGDDGTIRNQLVVVYRVCLGLDVLWNK